MSYFSNYLKAIAHPLPELDSSFSAELKFLIAQVKKKDVVLDVGCGAGRPADKIAPHVHELIGIDIDPEMLDVARRRCAHLKNVVIQRGNALDLDFEDATFDVTYATYNLIGSVPDEDIKPLLDEMVRVTKTGGRVINLTWKDDKQTTDFLEKYYPSIDLDILEITDEYTATSKGIFVRFSRKELIDLHKKAGLKDNKVFDVGPVWMVVVGVKP